MNGQKITIRTYEVGEDLSIVFAGRLEKSLIVVDNNPGNLRLVSKERRRFGESSFSRINIVYDITGATPKLVRYTSIDSVGDNVFDDAKLDDGRAQI